MQTNDEFLLSIVVVVYLKRNLLIKSKHKLKLRLYKTQNIYIRTYINNKQCHISKQVHIIGAQEGGS